MIKKLLKYFFLPLIILSGLWGYYSFFYYSVTSYAQVSTKVDVTPFLNAGCKQNASNEMDCSNAEALKPFACEHTYIVPAELGALDPASAIIECEFVNSYEKERPGILYKGCRLPAMGSYIVASKTGFRELKTPEEFKAFFAPLTTPEEALAYAMALTGHEAWYTIKKPAGFKLMTHHMETTYSKESPQGYLVHLFDYALCGCGPHAFFSVDFLVSKEGTITSQNFTNLFRNPKEDGLCVD